MVNLNDVNVFVRVVEAGSFVGAGKLLSMPPTTVSRKVQQLEANLGVRLLNRSTRKLSLTDAGEQYFCHCHQHMLGIEEANQWVSQAQTYPKGRLRITAPLDFAVMYVQPWINAFLMRYPEVDIELKLTDHQVDLIEERIDVAFRSGVLSDSSLVARRLLPKISVCCASHDYLARHGAPVHPRQLTDHQCVLWGNAVQGQSWHFRSEQQQLDVPVRGRYAADATQLLIEAAVAGVGIAKLPRPLVEPYVERQQLRVLFPEFEIPSGNMYVVYQSHRYLSQCVRQFIDFVLQQLPD